MLSIDADQPRDLFTKTNRRTFNSHGLTSANEFAENFRSEVFSSDGPEKRQPQQREPEIIVNDYFAQKGNQMGF